MKRISTFGARALMTLALLVMTAVSAMAVDVTYKLTTHFDGRTLEENKAQNVGDELKLPLHMMRGWTDYTYYSDEARTTPITHLPSGVTTVYVDYVFNSPFLISNEYGNVPYTVNVSSRQIINLRNDSGTTPFTWVGSYQAFNFFGDSYCLWLEAASTTENFGKWLTWNPEDDGTRIMVDDRPDVGWQLLRSKNTSGSQSSLLYFALGTCVDNQAAPGKYIGHLEETDHGLNTQNYNGTLPESKFDEDYALINMTGNIPESDNTNTKLYSLYCYINKGGSASNPRYIRYNFYYSWGEQIYFFAFGFSKTIKVDPAATTSSVSTETRVHNAIASVKLVYPESDFNYEYYWDPDMAEAHKYTNPTSQFYYPDLTKAVTPNHDYTVYVKLTPKTYYQGRWTTLCYPDDMNDIRRLGDVTINEFDHVEGSGDSYRLIFTEVNQIKKNTPYLIKANNAYKYAYDELFERSVGEPTGTFYVTKPFAPASTEVSMVGTLEEQTLTYQGDSPYLFFMGYKTAADINETPKFYHIGETSPARTIGAHHAWFEINDPTPHRVPGR